MRRILMYLASRNFSDIRQPWPHQCLRCMALKPVIFLFRKLHVCVIPADLLTQSQLAPKQTATYRVFDSVHARYLKYLNRCTNRPVERPRRNSQ